MNQDRGKAPWDFFVREKIFLRVSRKLLIGLWLCNGSSTVITTGARSELKLRINSEKPRRAVQPEAFVFIERFPLNPCSTFSSRLQKQKKEQKRLESKKNIFTTRFVFTNSPL